MRKLDRRPLACADEDGFPRPKKEGEDGRKKINQYTSYGTVVLAAFQAYGIAVGLESQTTSVGPVVHDPGLFFPGGPEDPSFGLLKLTPWRIELWSLNDLMTGKPATVWRR